MTLPPDFTRCLGVLEEHSAEQSCPRRYACARFLDSEDMADFQRIRWAMCDAGHDYFIGRPHDPLD